MIKNIPNKYTQQMVLKEINERHDGLYDFFYLPIDPKNKCNQGYAFINLTHPAVILSLLCEFNNKKWTKFNSEKICEFAYARIQTKEALYKSFQGKGVMQ